MYVLKEEVGKLQQTSELLSYKKKLNGQSDEKLSVSNIIHIWYSISSKMVTRWFAVKALKSQSSKASSFLIDHMIWVFH